MSLNLFGIYDYYSEIFFTVPNDARLYHHYITYDNNKIKGIKKGFSFDDMKTYLLKAWARIPVSGNEILDLYVSSLQNKDIDNFTVQYRTIFDPNLLNSSKILIPLLPNYTQNDIHMMLIRSDYGYKNKIPHFNIDFYNKEGIKINSDENSHFEQNFKIPFYEMIFHFVFMQVEKHNKLIGPNYWLSPFQIHLDRVYSCYEAWKKSEIVTPLCILSRNIHTSILLETHEKNTELSENDFQRILNKEIDDCKTFEKDNSEDFKVNIPSLEDIFVLPFNFFKPDDNAITSSIVYNDKLPQPLQFEPLGAIYYNRSTKYFNSSLS